MTRALRAGDHVRVISPAGPVAADVLHRGVARLRGWGLRVSLAAHALDRHPDLPYLGGTDADRAADLRAAWYDPDVDAVLCARGGYGCLRLLDLLDWPALAAAAPKPFAEAKPFVGSSDATALHRAFARVGVPTVFGPMIATAAFTSDDPAPEGLRAALFAPDRPITVTGADTDVDPGAGPLVPGATGGRAGGVTAGGNASLLAALAGSAEGGPPPPGAIVLLEDVGEEPYRLDRIVTQLARAGWFDRAAGIALGSWVSCGAPENVRAMLADLLAGLGVPVAWGLSFGHGPGQATIPLGVSAELDADAGVLTVAGR